jgi:hypothetical protein
LTSQLTEILLKLLGFSLKASLPKAKHSLSGVKVPHITVKHARTKAKDVHIRVKLHFSSVKVTLSSVKVAHIRVKDAHIVTILVHIMTIVVFSSVKVAL